MSAVSLSQQITRLLGTGDWVILHSGHTMVTNEELDALELADDVRASEAGDTEWDRQNNPAGESIRSGFQDLGNGAYRVLGVRRSALTGRYLTGHTPDAPDTDSTGEVPCEECSGVLVHMIDCSRRVKHHPTDAKPFDTSPEPVKNGPDSSHVPTGEEQR